jgi:hypothetical protein
MSARSTRARRRRRYQSPQGIRIKGCERDGLLPLLRDIGLRALGRIELCDELLEFVSSILDQADRQRVMDRLHIYAAIKDLQISQEDFLPSKESSCISRLAQEIANRRKGGSTAKELSGVLVESMTEALAAHANQGRRITASGELATGMAKIARVFGLSQEHEAVLLFYYSVGECSELSSLFEAFSSQQKPSFISVCTGLSVSTISKALLESGTLLESGLVERDDDDLAVSVRVTPLLQDSLSGIEGGLSHERLCAPAGPARFQLDEYAVDYLEVSICRSLLSRAEPRNILLYGEPGTGKSEFAKSLAAACGLCAFVLGNRVSGSLKERQATLIAAVAGLDPTKELLIVDEAETLLSASDHFSAALPR